MVQGVVRLPAGHDDVALVELEPNGPCNPPRGLVHELLKGLSFRGVPIAVVDELRVTACEAVAKVHYLAVHRYGLDGPSADVQYRTAGCLVYAPRLHAHYTALHAVHPSYGVPAAEPIEVLQKLRRAELPAVYRDRVSVLESDGYVGSLVRGLFRWYGHDVCILGRLLFEVLEYPSFEAYVEEVAVDAVWLLLCGRDRNTVLLGIGDQVGPSLQVPYAPWRYDLYVRVYRIVGKLEPHLVVSLARGAVGDRVGPHLPCNIHLCLGYEWSRDGCAEKVGPLVYGPCPEHGEYEVPCELLLQVLYVYRFRTALERLRA